MRSEPRFLPMTFLMLGGFIVWALHFLAVYGFTGLLCERPDWANHQLFGLSIIDAGIAIATLLALMAIAVLVVFRDVFRKRSGKSVPTTDPAFPGHLALGAAGLGGIAVLWQGLFSILTVPSCY